MDKRLGITKPQLSAVAYIISLAVRFPAVIIKDSLRFAYILTGLNNMDPFTSVTFPESGFADTSKPLKCSLRKSLFPTSL